MEKSDDEQSTTDGVSSYQTKSTNDSSQKSKLSKTTDSAKTVDINSLKEEIKEERK